MGSWSLQYLCEKRLQTYFDGAFQLVAFDCLTVVEAVQVVQVEVEMQAMIQVVWWK